MSAWLEEWTENENKTFELALAQHYNSLDRWERIAERLPNRSPAELQRYYQQLEDDLRRIDNGLVPVPHYYPSAAALPLPLHQQQHLGQPVQQQQCPAGARGSEEAGSKPPPTPKKNKVEPANNPADRRKGVPWTEEEHKLFLLGLAKFGKGDWRSIARNFVVSRTPTQVASHAQKYFIRLNSANKRGEGKRRASIHDITTATIGKGATADVVMVEGC